MKRLLMLSLILCVPVSARTPCVSLRDLARGLTFNTSVEMPIRAFAYQGKAAQLFLERAKALKDLPCHPFRTFEREALWLVDPYASEYAPRKNLKRLKALVAYMRANLTDLQTAFFGDEPEYEVYVFGRDKCGNVVGVRMVEVT